jgi:hypothetical protein
MGQVLVNTVLPTKIWTMPHGRPSVTAECDTNMKIRSRPCSSIEHPQLQSSSRLQTRTVKARTEKSGPRNPQTAFTNKVSKGSRQGSSLMEAIETGP